MPTTHKVLGQLAPPAGSTNYALYTVPANTSAVCSTLTVCNRSVANLTTTFRIAVRPAGAAIAIDQFIVYDAMIDPNDTLFFTLGITLGPGDIVSVWQGTPTLSFSLFGAELT
jgi:hypothetical protein